MKRILLVRHGRTDWNDCGRVQSWAPVPLDDLGRSQARELSEIVADRYCVDTVISSDLRRAAETTRILLSSTSLRDDTVTYSEAWRERNFGVYQGLTDEDLSRSFSRFLPGTAGADALEERPLLGESIHETETRVWERWREISRHDVGDSTTLVVTHQTPIRLVVGRIQGRSTLESMTDIEVKNCSLTEVTVDGSGEAATEETITTSR